MTPDCQLKTPKDFFINALRRGKPVGRVPHFELVFFLTMEAFGKVHPLHRNYAQWQQMSAKERQLHREDMARTFIATAEKYEHSAIFVHQNPNEPEEILRQCETVKELSGGKYFIMIHGDSTYAIPPGDQFADFIFQMADEPDKLLEHAKRETEACFKFAERLQHCGTVDGFALCSDYCMNNNPFIAPEQFSIFIKPFLKELIAGYRSMGFYSIKHTDGNIMPIIDQLAECQPDALHSLDPQGAVDIAEVKRLYGDQLCLIGNVNCGLVDSGTEEEVRESTLYALEHGMPGGGYIFSTSNCIYTGMRLERYEMIHGLWKEYGIY